MAIKYIDKGKGYENLDRRDPELAVRAGESFNWYLGGDFVGIGPRDDLSETEEFFRGIMAEPSAEWKGVNRLVANGAWIARGDSKIHYLDTRMHHLRDLLKLETPENPLSVFMADSFPNLGGRILAFSLHRPDSRLYTKSTEFEIVAIPALETRKIKEAAIAIA